MSAYTPTMGEVRKAYAAGMRSGGAVGSAGTWRLEFNRWLAAHDAEKRAEWEKAEQGEVEWEYRYAEVYYGGEMYTYGPTGSPDWSFASAASAADGRVEDSDIVVRRRKAGPWVPVNENGENQ